MWQVVGIRRSLCLSLWAELLGTAVIREDRSCMASMCSRSPSLGPQAVFEEPRRKGRFTLGPLLGPLAIIQKKRQLVRATPSKEGGETSHPDLMTP